MTESRCMICMCECDDGQLSCEKTRCMKLVREFDRYDRDKDKTIDVNKLEEILKIGTDDEKNTENKS